MALARGGFVGAKAFGEHIGSYLGYVVTEKTEGRNVKVTQYNTFDINRSEITDIIYYDPSIYSANSLYEAIKAGYQEQGFNQPQIHVIINLSYCDSLQWLDDKLEEFKKETKNIMPPINVIIGQLDTISNNNLPQVGINDTGIAFLVSKLKQKKLKLLKNIKKNIKSIIN